MKVFLIILISISLFSCSNSSDNKEIPDRKGRETIRKEIIGIWELLKKKYGTKSDPSLVDPSEKEYLEIKADGTCQDDGYEAKWFLSYTDDFVIDSTSSTFFTKLTSLKPNSWNEYDRTIKPFQIKVQEENNIKYLYLTSLNSSVTKIYIRKN